MIYITGDCHSNFIRLNEENFPEQKDMGKDDIVIICGDFGGIWYNEGGRQYDIAEQWLDWLEERPFTTVFCCGNHENFDRLYRYPEKIWKGGNVHQIRSSVYHLMRGEVFEINDTKIFAFGGASSHDIYDGILDCNDPEWRQKARILDAQGKYMYRVKGLSWWSQELPTQDEMDNGIANLAKHDNTVDFIVTHTPPANTIALLGSGLYDQDILTKYLEEIRVKANFKKWFSGHMHINKSVNEKEIILYEQIIRIA